MKFSAICTGELVPISQVPDVVFSDKMMGDGVAFIPNNNRIVAPVDGEIIFRYPTGHALGIRTPEGIELLIHFGLGSFQVPEGMIQSAVDVGDRIHRTDLLMSVDLNYFASQGINCITPVVFTSGEKIAGEISNQSVKEGEDLIGLVE